MADNGANNPDDVDVFVYMGEGMIVPNDVVRARVHPSVTVIPANAFMNCRRKLEEAELHHIPYLQSIETNGNTFHC